MRFATLAFSTALLAGCANFDSAPQPAKNVIVFIGDGMGVSTVTAARIFDGQSRGETGEENLLSFERFPRTAVVKTYNTNQQVPDSAGTATAIHTGIKTRAGVINVGPDARRRACAEAQRERLTPFGERVRDSGKALGIVTTTRITHATPATIYGSTPERDYESDRWIAPEDAEAGCVDMATQLLAFDEAHGIHIALGGGLREFYGANKNGKRRAADADLVSAWLAGGDDRAFISRADELDEIDPGQRVIGLFSSSHMEYIGRRKPETTQPTLQQMALAAVGHLEAQGTGYYLLIEGGRIDHGHHDGYPGLAMLETQAFAETVQLVTDSVDLDETLVLVTADHSHVMSIGGYPTRGNPILGHVVGNDDHGEPMQKPKLASDGQPYTTIGYANGPFAIVEGPRPEPETGIHARAQALYRLDYVDLDGVEYSSESHGGEDVVLYATGRGSDCVAGVIEQNRIYDFITAAFGWRAPVCPD